MPRRLVITIVCFHVTAVLSVIVGTLVGAFGAAFGGTFGSLLRDLQVSETTPRECLFPIAFWLFAVFAVAALLTWVAALEIAVWGLNRRKYWAWVLGLVLCGLLIVSGTQNGVGLLLGGLGLWGLVDPETLAAFRPSSPENEQPQDPTEI